MIGSISRQGFRGFLFVTNMVVQNTMCSEFLDQ